MDSPKISFSGKFAQVPPPWLVNGVFNAVFCCRPSALLGFASGPQLLSKSSCPRGGFDTETLTFFHPRAVRPFFFPLIYSFRLTDYQCFLAESGNKSSSCYWSDTHPINETNEEPFGIDASFEPLGNSQASSGFLRSPLLRRHVRTNKEIEKVKWLICVNSSGKVTTEVYWPFTGRCNKCMGMIGWRSWQAGWVFNKFFQAGFPSCLKKARPWTGDYP